MNLPTPPVSTFGSRFRTIMLAGLIAILPLFLTLWILGVMLGLMDGILSPLISPLIVNYLNSANITNLAKGTPIPGVGLVATAIVVLIAGLLVRNIVGRELVASFERLLSKVPVAGWFFSSFKEIMGVFSQKKAFSQVVVIEYPRDNTWGIGFVTGRTDEGIRKALGGAGFTYVYVPTTPNPTSGVLLMVPSDRVFPLPLTIEEGLKLVVSAGIISDKGGKGAAG
jgi:uncharacterized membrane protein